MRRVAVVAGGSGVIGQAVCRAMRSSGATVVCGYAGAEEKAARLAGELGGLSVRLAADSDPAAALRGIYDKTGRLDILINASGINLESSAPAMRPEDWSAVQSVNLDFAFRLSQAALPFMLPERWGRIVHISSVSARAGGRGQINYAASKAGLERMARVLALEVGRKGITVNCVAPGVIESEMSARVRAEHGAELLAAIAAKRYGKAEEVAAAVAFLAGEDAGYINGAVIPVDGGMML